MHARGCLVGERNACGTWAECVIESASDYSSKYADLKRLRAWRLELERSKHCPSGFHVASQLSNRSLAISATCSIRDAGYRCPPLAEESRRTTPEECRRLSSSNRPHDECARSLLSDITGDRYIRRKRASAAICVAVAPKSRSNSDRGQLRAICIHASYSYGSAHLRAEFPDVFTSVDASVPRSARRHCRLIETTQSSYWRSRPPFATANPISMQLRLRASFLSLNNKHSRDSARAIFLFRLHF